jgi:hypothetical protein
MPRWSAKEATGIAIVRARLADALAGSPNYPEVVGDRKIVRFLRGHDYNIEKVVELFDKFLTWRRINKVNDIRQDIVERGLDHPLRFPKGDIILSLISQLVIDPGALDVCGSPICVEQYNFSPTKVMSHITIDEYIHYMIYSLEYRSLIIEQLSEQRERAYLASLSLEDRLRIDDEDSDLPPYGVLASTCVIRDLSK